MGESERAVRQCFQRARNSAPCVIFFDELDALCPKRSDHDSSGSVRVVNQLLTEMDGMESRQQIFLIGATNRPDIIDPAILRPGRFDKILYVGFPNAEDRSEILRTLSKNKTEPPIAADFDLSSVARDPRAQNYTGADLAALLREASVVALKAQIEFRLAQQSLQSLPGQSTFGQLLPGQSKFESEIQKSKQNQNTGQSNFESTNFESENRKSIDSDSKSREIRGEHFDRAFEIVKPSVSDEERKKYEILRLKYGSD